MDREFCIIERMAHAMRIEKRPAVVAGLGSE